MFAILRKPIRDRGCPMEPLHDRFASLNLGNTLILKLCGFIESRRAEILDVEEGFLRLRVNESIRQRRLPFGLFRSALEVRLTFSELDGTTLNPDVDWHPQSRYSQVSATISPLGIRWTADAFRQESRRLLWDLRAHLVAS